MQPATKSKLLLACGNPLRGDDGVGWKIAEAVEHDPGFADVKVVVVQQFTPELSELLRDADVVVFVDASASEEPGAVRSVAVQAAEQVPQALTHHLPPASLLALTGYLYGRIPGRAHAVTVGASSFELSLGAEGRPAEGALSDAVREAIPAAVALLRELFMV